MLLRRRRIAVHLDRLYRPGSADGEVDRVRGSVDVLEVSGVLLRFDGGQRVAQGNRRRIFST
jgi:hypothetical protein